MFDNGGQGIIIKLLLISIKVVINNLLCGWNHKPKALFIIRVILGLIFISHGVSKLQNIAGTTQFFTKLSIPMPAVMAWVVALVETLGGAAMVLGIGVGFAGILLSIIMIVAILTAKAGSPGGILGAELEFMLLASAIGVALGGAGKWSLHDALYKNHSHGK